MRAGAADPDPALPKCLADWKVEVVAEKPALRSPSMVCTAPDGRIFVAQDLMDMAPHSEIPIDSILCFHPDGHVTEFATNLHAVFGMAYVDGKLYVHHCPLFTVFTDDHGVGRDPVNLFTTNPNPTGNGGFNDHIPSNMRLAMDGYFYLSTGDKGIFGATGKDGSKVTIHGGGIMRFRPDGTQLEVYTTGTRNHLDVAINSEDDMFTYDNTDDGQGWWTRVTHMVDGGYYGYPYDYRPQRPYTLWMMTDFGGGAPTGALSYNEDALPEKYHGNLFLCDWAKAQLLRVTISRAGGSFKFDFKEVLLDIGTQEFRPVGIAVSVDGMSLYVTDWNMAGWKRPDFAGRLLKVTYTGANHSTPKPTWWVAAGTAQPFQATTQELIAGLKHPAQCVRMVAQRRLAERGKEAGTALAALLKDDDSPALARIHALWALDAIDAGASAQNEILTVLRDKDDAVRAQAIRQIGTRRNREALKPLLTLLADANPVIRFQVATALGRIGDSSAVPALVQALAEKDFFTRYAIFTALNRIGRADSSAWAGIVRGLSSPTASIREGVLFAMRETHDEAVVKALAEFAASPDGNADTRAAALAVLADLHRKQPAWDGTWWSTQPVASPPPPKTVEWAGTAEVQAAIQRALTDESTQIRRVAINAVAGLADKEAAAGLRQAFVQERDAANRQAILRALGSLRDTAADELLAGLLADAKDNPGLLQEAIHAAGQIGDHTMVVSLVKILAVASIRSRAVATSKAEESSVAAWKTVYASAVEALGNTRAPEAVPQLIGIVTGPDSNARSMAAAALQHIGGPTTRALVTPLMSRPDMALRRTAIEILASLHDRTLIPDFKAACTNQDTREAAMAALSRIPDLSNLDLFLNYIDDPNEAVRSAASSAITSLADPALKAIEARHQAQPFAGAKLAAIQQIYLRNPPARSGPLFAGVPKPLEPAAYAEFAGRNNGAAGRGQIVFNDVARTGCIKCHRVKGQGGEVGPDLTGVGSKYNRAQLIESVLYPSRQILDGYHQTVVTLNNGETLNGILRGTSPTQINLVNSDGKTMTFQRSEIRELKESSLSLMPEGLQAALTLDEFADLAAFLESLRESGQGATRK